MEIWIERRPKKSQKIEVKSGYKLYPKILKELF
jgi:hypothetical protein